MCGSHSRHATRLASAASTSERLGDGSAYGFFSVELDATSRARLRARVRERREEPGEALREADRGRAFVARRGGGKHPEQLLVLGALASAEAVVEHEHARHGGVGVARGAVMRHRGVT